MSSNNFYGRAEELNLLKKLLSKRTASLVVIKGRRRIGKSRLIAEFIKSVKGGKKYISNGLAPSSTISSQMEREDFAAQMHRELGIPGLGKIEDWGDLFWHLAQQVKEERVVLVFDEINWMGSKDPTFLAKLKTAWDLYFKNNNQLILILSGSMSSWIEENIVSSSGFLGRISVDMTLRELPLGVCGEFWGSHSKNVSPYEKLKLLSVTGGIPRYLEEMHPQWSAEENIRQLCFRSEGLLFKEFDRIFNDLFVRRGEVYRAILRALSHRSATLSEICEEIKMKRGGTISHYLDNLKTNEYVSEDVTWHIDSGRESKISRYRLKDNYLRFYLRFVEPHKGRIARGTLASLPGWDGVMGLQFENLVLANRSLIFEQLRIQTSEIINENPFFQKKTKLNPGCQIDYMIQTKFNTLYLCEIKFSTNKIGKWVIDECRGKVQRLKRKGIYTIRPVLIHVNGVTKEVLESDYFAHIIDFGALF